MGTFEKLGILVIVVIIVMILAVAIYQWGGTAAEPFAVTPQGSGLLTVDLDDLKMDEEQGQEAANDTVDVLPTPEAWPGGIPKSYEIQKNDKLWVIVVKRWGLKESFIAAIVAANPKVDVKRLRPGKELSIPDPTAYRTGRAPQAAPAGGRTYEVQGGDTLESIAHRHLGKRSRWPEIVALNPSLNPKRLMEGQEILLPLK